MSAGRSEQSLQKKTLRVQIEPMKGGIPGVLGRLERIRDGNLPRWFGVATMFIDSRCEEKRMK